MKFNNNYHVSPSADIAESVKIGDHTIIYPNVIVEPGCIIANHCVIGEPLNSYYYDENYENPPTIIRRNSLIRSHTIIYAGSEFGEELQTGHRVTIRENTIAGRNCLFGTNTDIQGNCKIGNYCKFHSFVNIGQKSNISDFVFIYPFVVLTNDPTPPSNHLLGVDIGSFTQISASSTILPGKKIGSHSLVGAGSMVGIDIPDFTFATGNPAKLVGDLRRMPFFSDGHRHYPWPNNFTRGMPWEGSSYEEWQRKSDFPAGQ